MVIELEHPIFGFERSNIELRKLFDPSLQIIDLKIQMAIHGIAGLQVNRVYSKVPYSLDMSFSKYLEVHYQKDLAPKLS